MVVFALAGQNSHITYILLYLLFLCSSSSGRIDEFSSQLYNLSIFRLCENIIYPRTYLIYKLFSKNNYIYETYLINPPSSCPLQVFRSRGRTFFFFLLSINLDFNPSCGSINSQNYPIHLLFSSYSYN